METLIEYLTLSHFMVMLVGIPSLPVASFLILRQFFEVGKKSKLIEISIYTLLPISGFLHFASGIPGSPMLSMLRTYFFYFAFPLLYEGSKLKKIASSFTIIVIMAIVDGMTMFFFEMGNSLMHELPLDQYIVIFLAAIIIYLLPFSLKPFSFFKKDNLPKWIWLVIIFAASILTIVSLFIMILDLYLLTHTVVMVSIFLVWMLILYLLDKFSISYAKEQSALMEVQEKVHYQTQYQLIQENFENSRDMRHDFKLHLNTLEEQLRSSPEEAQKYVAQLLEQSKKNVIHSNTGHVIFDAVINGELGKITNNATAVEVDIKIPIDLKVDSIDVTKILGNLLTNAITATTTIENPFINLKTHYSKGQLFIALENSFDGIVIYEKDQIISRYDGENRGRGLKIVRKAVQQYDGEMKIIHDEDKFTVKIVMYV